MATKNLAGIFTAALMKGNPSINKKRAAQVWNDVSSKVEVGQVTSDQLAKIAYQIAQQTKPKFADGGPVDSTQLEPVTITPPVKKLTMPEVNTPSDYLTPEQAQAQSDLLTKNQAGLGKENPFDPEALRAAYAQYQEYINRNALGRGVGGLMAGSVAGSSGGQSVTQHQAAWKESDTNAQNMTIGMQKALMDQYKSGLDVNKNLMDSLKTNAQFKIDASKAKLDQTKTQAELVPILQNANTRMQWANPNSDQSKAAQDIGAVTAYKLGFDNDFVNRNIAKKSAVEISMILSGLIPNAVDLISKATTTAKTQAEVPGVQAESAIKGAAAGSVVTPQGTLQTQPGQVTSISAGPVSITNPGAATESTAAAEDRAKTALQIKNYETLAKPAIDDALKLIDKTYTGKGGHAIARFLPGNDQAMVANAIGQVYSMYPDALPPAVGATIKNQMDISRQNGGQWTGVPTLDLTPTQMKTILMQAKANIERIKNYRTSQTEFENKGGKPTDFYKTPEASGGITTREQYDKLPSGAEYTGPDGVRYTKE